FRHHRALPFEHSFSFSVAALKFVSSKKSPGMEIQKIIDDAKNHMEKTMQHLETELTHVRAGKISPAMLDGISVDYYGSHMPINQTANVSIADARTLVIQPWE